MNCFENLHLHVCCDIFHYSHAAEHFSNCRVILFVLLHFSIAATLLVATDVVVSVSAYRR